LGEELVDRARDLAADVRYQLEHRPWQASHEPEVAEPRGQRLRRGFADMPDAEGIQESLEGGRAAAVDRGDQVVRPARRDLAGPYGLGRGAVALVRAAPHPDQGVAIQRVQVRDRGDVAEVGQVRDQAFAEAFDVHRATRREVEQRLVALRGASQVAAAAGHDFALLAHD